MRAESVAAFAKASALETRRSAFTKLSQVSLLKGTWQPTLSWVSRAPQNGWSAKTDATTDGRPALTTAWVRSGAAVVNGG